MTNTCRRQSASPLLGLPKLQLIEFDDIVKLQLANIMHFVRRNKISNLYFVFSRVKNFYYFLTQGHTQKFLRGVFNFEKETRPNCTFGSFILTINKKVVTISPKIFKLKRIE